VFGRQNAEPVAELLEPEGLLAKEGAGLDEVAPADGQREGLPAAHGRVVRPLVGQTGRGLDQEASPFLVAAYPLGTKVGDYPRPAQADHLLQLFEDRLIDGTSLRNPPGGEVVVLEVVTLADLVGQQARPTVLLSNHVGHPGAPHGPV